jgi:pyruvate/2-oxoglutarate dehydrogenase complex dihydrolipoamide dehydrogenase (E3) component
VVLPRANALQVEDLALQEWIMTEHADVVILGMGTCGEDLAHQLLEAGLTVIGIEPALLGGECAYWACIPSKMMIRAANLLAEARRVDGMAGRADVISEWEPVARRIRAEASGDWDDTVAVGRFEGKGGRFVRGRGRLEGPRRVIVDGQRVEASIGVVVATGSQPTIPPVPGLADAGYWTTHEAIRVDELPRSLVVLGGGAVGCELGQVFARFGVDVTIVEGRDRLLATEEPEAGETLRDALGAEGISAMTGTHAVHVQRLADGVHVALNTGSTVVADQLLVATGRHVDLSGLGLDSVGLDPAASFINVDDRLRASEGLWAMGDITGKAMFTHVALYQASIVAADILGHAPPPADYSAVPRVVFTDPEVAAVGHTEAAARALGIDAVATVKLLPATFRGWLHGPGNAGFVKLVADGAAGTLVGATAVGPHGGEVLGALSVAVRAQVPLADLRHMIYAFPTFYGALGEAIGAYAVGLQQVLDPDGDRSLHAR